MRWDEVYVEPVRPTIEVKVADRPDPPRLLGPDGRPLPRLAHRFGFAPAPEWS